MEETPHHMLLPALRRDESDTSFKTEPCVNKSDEFKIEEKNKVSICSLGGRAGSDAFNVSHSFRDKQKNI